MNPILASQTVVLAVFSAFTLLSSACSIDTRADAYRCGNDTDCSDGRTCQGGWCLAPPDAAPCPDVCTSCLADGTCVIVCSDTLACPAGVTCPAGRPCEVECMGDQSCAGGVDCTQATACDIDCGGISSCTGAMSCGSGACVVDCGGQNSCVGPVDCSQSCACDTDCSGTNACPGQIHECPASGNCENGGACRSNVGGCDMC
jgi:hypothetical protein